MRRTHGKYRAVSVLAAAALVVAACGSDSDESTGTVEPAGDPAAAAVTDDISEEAPAVDGESVDTGTTVPTEPEVDQSERVGVVFVGHGEPATFADGDVAITFPDGRVLGPFGDTLGVPAAAQTTEWAAAYDEIATAMTYVFGDVNGNETLHEMMISPAGDVPPFFTWDAFRAELSEIYGSFGDYSPHGDLIAEHVENVVLDVDGVEIGTHLAYLDTVPRIPDVMAEISDDYDHFVVVPMLLASSTHTQEIATQIEESVSEDADIVVVDPFYEVPYMRDRVAAAVVAMTDQLRAVVPADVPDDRIGILLVAHGTPYVPDDPAFGWQEGEIYSHLSLIEDGFHDELAAALPYPAKTGRMNYAEPSIPVSLSQFAGEGIEHVLVVPTAFPTAAMHTMWDVAEPAIGRAVTPDEGIVVHTHDSGITAYYTSEGYADLEPGRQEFRDGLTHLAELGVREALGLEATT